MKIFREFWVVIFSIVIFAFLLVLSLSFITKNVIQKQIVTIAVKDVVVKQYVPKEELTEEEQKTLEKIEEVLNNEDVQKFAGILIDEFGRSIQTDNYKVQDKSVDEIIELCVKHIDLINEFSDEEITEDDIRSAKTKETIKDGFNEILSENKIDEIEDVRFILDCYNLFISNIFRLIILLCIGLFVSIIGLIKWSYYKWMRPLGISLISCGILVSILYMAAQIAINEFEKEQQFNFGFNFIGILVIGLIEIVLGIIFIIVNRSIRLRLEGDPDELKD